MVFLELIHCINYYFPDFKSYSVKDELNLS